MRGEMNGAGAPWRIGRPIPPVPGESLDGYVARVAASNWIDKVVDLSRLAGVRYAVSPVLTTQCWDGLPVLADCLGVDVVELQVRSYPKAEIPGHRLFFGLPVGRGEIESYKRRFAPKSFAIAGHHRALWQLRSFPFCDETWQYLIDQCPRCGAIQRWQHANGVDRCDHCIADLSSAAAPEVPQDQRDALSDAIGLVHPDADRKTRSLAKLPKPLGGLNAASAYELLFCTAAMLAPRMDRVRHNCSRSRPDAIITKAVAEAWTLLREWPHGPQAYFVERILTSTKSHDDGNDGRNARFLKLPVYGQVTPPVAEVISDLRASIDLSGPRREQLLRLTSDIREASKILGTGTQPLTSIRRKGGLNTVFLMNKDHATVRFDTSEIKSIGVALKDRHRPEQVAWKYGLPVYAIEQCMAMKIIATFADRFCLLRYGSRQMTRQAVSQFEQRLASAATVAKFDHPVTLIYASRAIGGRLKPWGPIFDALLSGVIPFAVMDGPSRLVHRIIIDRSALTHLEGLTFDTAAFPDATLRKIIKRLEAGEILNLDQKYIADVANQLPAYGGDQKDLALQDVLNVARTHIGSRELGMRLNLPLSADKFAQKAEIPKLGPAGWCRRQVEARLLSEPRSARASRSMRPLGSPRVARKHIGARSDKARRECA